jgi:hypothetical protein
VNHFPDRPALIDQIQAADTVGFSSVDSAEIWLDGPLNGGSQAHHVSCTDGREFAAKFVGNPQGDHILTREFVFARVARLLGNVAPETVVIDVPAAFLAASPKIVGARPGPAVGSTWTPGTFDSKFGMNATLPLIAQDLAQVIVFQTWCGAVGWDPVALVDASTGRVWSIDHGLYAPPGTDLTGSAGHNGVVIPGGMTAQTALNLVKDQLPRVLQSLYGLTSDKLIEAFGGVPAEWASSPEERADMALYLARRITMVGSMFRL